MADRVTKVSLTANVGNYVSGFEQARSATSKFSEDATQHLEKQKAAMERVGTAALAFGAVAAAAVGVAASRYAEFDEAMSAVQAATHESADNMALLRDAAIEAGSSTVFTAKEAANAIEELAKSGLSTSEILGGALNGALSLAAASGIGVAEAAEIASKTLNQFNLEGSDAEHVADLLAAGAGKASGEVGDLGMALAQVGQVANGAGLTIEETTTALAAFASQGLLGSDAGTSFKTMLGALTPNSAKAADEMKRLGLTAYDANGNFVGLEEYAGRLKTAFSGLTPEARSASMEIIFGSDAVRAATSLYNEGAEGIAEWSEKVDDTGYAAETAAIRLDNLNGDVEKLGGAFDTLLIKSGSAADGLLRGVVQGATQLVDAFNDAPLFVQQTALALAGVAAATALAGGAFLVGVPQVAAFSAALATLSESSMPGVAKGADVIRGATSRAATMLSATAKFLTGPWGIALAAAGVGVTALSDLLKDLQASSEEITNSLKTATSAADIFKVALQGKDVKFITDVKGDLNDLDKVLAASAEQSGNLFARFDSTYFPAFDALRDVGKQLSELATSDLPSAQKAFRLLVAETDGSEQSQWRLLNATEGYKEALTAQANQLGINVTSGSDAENQTALLALAFGDASDSAMSATESYTAAKEQTDELQQSVTDLLDSFNELNGVNQDAVSTNAAFQASLAGITDQVQQQKDAFIQLQSDAYEAANGNLDEFVGTLDGFSLSLDQNSVSGSANAEMLSQVASDAQAAAQAQYEVDKTTVGAKAATDTYVGTLATSKQALIDGAVAAGYNKDEVQKLADQVFRLPDQKQIDILADTSSAVSTVDDLVRALNNRVATIQVNATNPNVGFGLGDGSANGNLYSGGVKQAFASGGFASGIYAGRPGGIHKFAEPETGWEAYISGKPGMERRNASIAFNALGRLGYGVPAQQSVAPQFNVVLSSKGGIDLTQYIDAQIVAADQRSNMTSMMGVQ